MTLTLGRWLQERLDNCRRIALAAKTGEDRAGWLEDARYFKAAIDTLTTSEQQGADAVKRVRELETALNSLMQRFARVTCAVPNCECLSAQAYRQAESVFQRKGETA